MKFAAPLAILCLSTSALAGNPEIPPSTPEQVEAFMQADGNDDGALTQNEFRVFVEKMADEGEPTAKFIRTLSAHSIAFAQVDRDSDGYARPFEIYEANTAFEAGEESVSGLPNDK